MKDDLFKLKGSEYFKDKSYFKHISIYFNYNQMIRYAFHISFDYIINYVSFSKIIFQNCTA